MLHRGLLDHHTHRAITMYVGRPSPAKGKVQQTCYLDQRKSSTETWLGHRREGYVVGYEHERDGTLNRRCRVYIARGFVGSKMYRR